MRKYKPVALLISLLLVLAVVLSGCGGQGQQAAKEGGKTFVFARSGDAVGLDPANVTDGESLYVTHQIFETLLNYKPTDTELVPGLATSWENSKDGREWTLTLRKGVKFQDGTPFNAQAVKFNFDRWRLPNNKYHVGGNFEYYTSMFGGFPGVIKDVQVVDDYTVKFILTRPLAPFLADLAMPTFGIASPAAVEKYGKDFFKHPVGTGPFTFVSWDKDQKIVLKRNDNYWGPRPALDEVVFRTIPDNSARLMELKSGTIDAMIGLNPDDYKTVKDDPNLQVLLRPSMNVGYLALNNLKKPFNDPRVRQAIACAIDKKALIDAFYAGLGKPAKNPLPPSVWGYNDSIQDYPYDPAKAKELLAEAGYPHGFTTTLWAMPVARPYMPQPKEIAQAIQADLAKVGIKANIVTYDWATYIAKGENGEHDMYLFGWTGDNGDPDNFLYVLLGKDNAVKGAASNVCFYQNEEVNNLLKQAQSVSDQSKRAALYEQAQAIIHQDEPMVPLVHSMEVVVAKKSVKNLIPHPTGTESFAGVDIQQ